jgi:hypothetical protein
MIYGRNYGPVYHCINYPKCDAYVGVHKGTRSALGRLANKELREHKKTAHYFFDFLWQTKKAQGDRNARSKGYAWLSKELGTPKKETHIGWFDVEMNKKVIELCKPYYHKIRNKGARRDVKR